MGVSRSAGNWWMRSRWLVDSLIDDRFSMPEKNISGVMIMITRENCMSFNNHELKYKWYFVCIHFLNIIFVLKICILYYLPFADAVCNTWTLLSHKITFQCHSKLYFSTSITKIEETKKANHLKFYHLFLLCIFFAYIILIQNI